MMEDLFGADPKLTETASIRLLKIREALVDRIWAGLTLVALVGVPASALRSFATGWLPLYTFHAVLGVFIVLVYIFRARIPFIVKSALLLLLLWTLGAVGLLQMGFFGIGFGWLVMTSLLAATIYSLRVGVIVGVAAIAVIAAAGFGFTQGILIVATDANVYVRSVYSWIALAAV